MDGHGDLAIRMGDYDKAELDKLATNSIVSNTVELYQKYAKGQQAIFFGVNRRHATITAARFRQAGIRAVYLGGDSSDSDRIRVIGEFRRGEVSVICNCDLISEGFDVPECSCVIQGRPTKSLTIYLQQAGRALRYIEGKTAIILDLAGNYKEHSLPDTPRNWSLAGRPKKTKREQSQTPNLAICEGCFAVIDSAAMVCPHCGHKRVQQAKEAMKERKVSELQAVNSDIPAETVIVKKTRILGKEMTISPKGALRMVHVFGGDEEKLKEVARVMGYNEGWAGHQSRRYNAWHRK